AEDHLAGTDGRRPAGCARLMIAGVMSLLARRLDNTSRDVSVIIDPVELRRLREQAEARKLAASSQSEPTQR
ncbi:hypothetical protein ACLMLE_27115, partial [Lysobacter capsici]